MIETKIKRENTKTLLEAALDQSVEAAFHLHVSEKQLVAQLVKTFHAKEAIAKKPQPRILFNPLAGP